MIVKVYSVFAARVLTTVVTPLKPVISAEPSVLAGLTPIVY